jgi:hypothetical protein
VVTLRTDGVASADGVQLGGGTFAPFVPELGGLAPAPWFEVAAVHQLPQLGGPESLLRLDDGNLISDMRFRARWTSWLTAPDDDVVFVSLHTNAGGGRGTMLFYGVDSDTSPSTPRPRGRHRARGPAPPRPQAAPAGGGARLAG